MEKDKELLITLAKISKLMDNTSTDLEELSVMVDEVGNIIEKILEEVKEV